MEKFGAGAGASRLICGSLAPFHELEEALAAFKGTEAALTFSTGYATALGTITALLGKDDIIIVDKLVHACIVDAARLCGAKLRVFAHNDLNDLEEILKWADKTRRAERGSAEHQPSRSHRHRIRFQHGRRPRAAARDRRAQGTIRRVADGGRSPRHRTLRREPARPGRSHSA